MVIIQKRVGQLCNQLFTIAHFTASAIENAPRAVQSANQSTARPVLSAVLSVERQILREFSEVAVSLMTFVRD